jgi:hypothetical protein
MVADGSFEAGWAKQDPLESVDRLKREIFEVLVADEVRWDMRRELTSSPPLIEALELFLHHLKNSRFGVPAARGRKWRWLAGTRARSARAFARSEQWTELKELAAAVSAAGRDAGLA